MRYNFRQLEDNIIEAYNNWKAEDNSTTRTQIFLTIKEIAYANLMVGKYEKYNLDYEEVSYEYGLYMFERIIKGSFTFTPKERPDNQLNQFGKAEKRFPFQLYVKRNIKHVIFTLRKSESWQDLLTDLEFLVDGEVFNVTEIADGQDPVDKVFDKFLYAKKLLSSLSIFYSEEEIKRLLGVSLELIYENNRYYISPTIPLDIKDFTITLIALSKRLVRDHNINFEIDIPKKQLSKVMASAVRSTVFLSAVVNSNFFPRELLITLDIDSLYRLINVCGGQTIKIPSLRELDTLIGSTVAVGKMIMEGKDYESSIMESKDTLGLVFTNNVNTQSFISKLLEVYDIYKEDPKSQPILSILAMSIKNMDVLFNQLQEKAKDLPAESLINQYTELATTFSKFTESLTNIKNNMPEGKLIPDMVKTHVDIGPPVDDNGKIIQQSKKIIDESIKIPTEVINEKESCSEVGEGSNTCV